MVTLHLYLVSHYFFSFCFSGRQPSASSFAGNSDLITFHRLTVTITSLTLRGKVYHVNNVQVECSKANSGIRRSEEEEDDERKIGKAIEKLDIKNDIKNNRSILFCPTSPFPVLLYNFKLNQTRITISYASYS